MILRIGHPRVSFSALMVLVALWSGPHTALAQPAAGASQMPADAETHTDKQASGANVWTCARHPEVRQDKAGKCPICARELTAVGAESVDEIPELMGLQEMLAIALKHNANVRAAQARVQAAEAELDRTRFDVLQQIMAFREKWQALQVRLQSALGELREARIAVENADTAKQPAADQLVAAATEEYSVLRAKLKEIEAELPFLLGKSPGQAVPPWDLTSRRFIRDELLPKARQLLELRIREYETGRTSMADLTAAYRQLTEFETRMAETNAQKIAAVETQKELLQHIRAIADARYRNGKGNQADVVAIHLELSKLDLFVLELKEQ